MRPLRACFLYSDKPREEELAKSFVAGINNSSDDCAIMMDRSSEIPDGYDVYAMIGVKSYKLFQQVREAGKHVVYFDKGYLRHRNPTGRVWEYWRVSVNDHHPTEYLTHADHLPDRWEQIKRKRRIVVPDWKEENGLVLYAGSSAKYHTFAGLPDPTEYAQQIVDQIREVWGGGVMYRPKPTWREAVEIQRCHFSPQSEDVRTALDRARCVVTHGSNICYDAIMTGTPCVILGNAVAKPISSESIEDVCSPYRAPKEQVDQWLQNLAWCQFTEDEIAIGLAWAAIRPQLYDDFLDETRLPFVSLEPSKPRKKK